MAETPTLSAFYDGWERFNQLLVTTVAPLTPERMTLRTADNERTISEIVAHIIATRAGSFHNVLGEGDATIASFCAWEEKDAPILNAAQMELGLETTWKLISSCLSRWTAADLGGEFTSWHGKPVTRQWVIWSVLEHDLFHGGELSLTLGSHGLTGIDL